MMTRAECIHILRNPWGRNPEELKEATLTACDELERLERKIDEALALLAK